MPLEFRTREDSTYPTVINGVGRLAAGGADGITVASASKVMHELQDRWGDPLEGKALGKAAREWAEGRELVVVVAKDRPPLTRQSRTTGEPDGEVDPDAENQEEAE